jgi:hypothetical protein
MASWVLTCTKCNSEFTHSTIEDTLANYFFATKPKFPDGGQQLDCPHCGHTGTYQHTDLIYQA